MATRIPFFLVTVENNTLLICHCTVFSLRIFAQPEVPRTDTLRFTSPNFFFASVERGDLIQPSDCDRVVVEMRVLLDVCAFKKIQICTNIALCDNSIAKFTSK